MKKVLLGLAVTTMMSSSWATTKNEVVNHLVPAGSESATWVSECKLSMKGVLEVNADKSFEMKLKAYSTSNCEEGSDYISLTRTGKYKHQDAVYQTVNYNDGYSYTYQSSPRQLSLDLSSIEVDSKGTLGALAEGLLSMYDGCIGTRPESEKSRKCINSGVSKTKSRVRLSSMEFITPTKILGEFRNDVNVEFTLVK